MRKIVSLPNGSGSITDAHYDYVEAEKKLNVKLVLFIIVSSIVCLGPLVVSAVKTMQYAISLWYVYHDCVWTSWWFMPDVASEHVKTHGIPFFVYVIPIAYIFGISAMGCYVAARTESGIWFAICILLMIIVPFIYGFGMSTFLDWCNPNANL